MKFAVKCQTCQKVKTRYQRTVTLLQPLPIPEWKWEKVIVNFVIGHPKSPRGSNAMWRLTNFAHFILFHVESPQRFKYISICRRCPDCIRVLIEIISDRVTRFSSHYQNSLQETMATNLGMSLAFHHQMNCQPEQINQILEDIVEGQCARLQRLMGGASLYGKVCKW